MSDLYLAKLAQTIKADEAWRTKVLAEFHMKSAQTPQGVFKPIPDVPEIRNLSDLEKQVEMQEVKYRAISTRVDEALSLAQPYDTGETDDISQGHALVQSMDVLLEDLEIEIDSVNKFREIADKRFNFDELRGMVDEFDHIREENREILKRFRLSKDSELYKKFNEFSDQISRYREKVKEQAMGDDAINEELRQLSQKAEKARKEFLRDIKEQYANVHSILYPPQELEDVEAGPKNNVEYIRHRVELIDSAITELGQNYKNDLATIKDSRSIVKRVLTDASINAGQLDIAQEGGSIITARYPKREDAPVVQIFEMYPPPTIDLKQDVSRLQREVQERFKQFQWPTIVAPPEKSPCDLSVAGSLNLAQKLTYHYMQPYNQYKKRVGVNALLVHSAGSGKSCTAAAIASIFGRAGYTIMLVSKRELKEEIQKAAMDNQCDFNIQQYTRGNELVPTVLSDLTSRLSARDPLLQTSTFKSNYGILLDYIKNVLKPSELEALKHKIPDKTEVGEPGEPGEIEPKDDSHDMDEFFDDEKQDDDEDEEEEDETTSTKKPAPQDPKKDKAFMSALRSYVQTEVLEKNMGISYYGDALSYQQLGGVNKNITSAKILEGTSDKSRTAIQKERKSTGDRLRKVFIIIDEAHKIVTHPSDILSGARPDFEALREAIWKSYEVSGAASCRVLLLTATPIVEHPLDAVNLLTLLNTRKECEALGFHKYGNIRENGPKGNEKPATGKQFIKDHWDSKKNTFKNPGKIAELFNGRISYFNYAGDPRFPQPFTIENGVKTSAVTYVPVKLSLTQTQLMVRCFEYPLKVDTDMGKIAMNAASGVYHYDVKTGALLLKKSANIKKVSRKIDSRALQIACIGINAVWPYEFDDPTLGKKVTAAQLLHKTTAEKRNAFFNDDQNLIRVSPLIYRLVQRIQSRKREATRSLQQLYMGLGRNIPFNRRLKGYKQYIFNDLIKSKANYGVKLIQAVLESRGYTRVNNPYKKGPLIKKAPDYMGMMVFDDSVVSGKDGGDATSAAEQTADKERQRELLKYFNSPDNVDGKRCALFLASGLFKEGISLFGIRYAHMVGFIGSHADMVQAVARAIRNCSRTRTYYKPNQGWTINVDVYSPIYPPENTSKDGPVIHPLQLLEASNPEIVTANIAKEEMNRIVKASAYDRLLLAPINDSSQQNQNAVQLWKNRRPDQVATKENYDYLGSRHDVTDFNDGSSRDSDGSSRDSDTATAMDLSSD